MLSKLISTLTLLSALPFAAGQNRGVTAPPPIPGISPPAIKMGLWEATTTTPNAAYTSRSCVTQKTYQSAFGKMPDGCAVKNPPQTPSSISADLVCTMNGANYTGHFNVQFSDSATAHTTVTYTVSMQGHTMQGNIKTDSHWVSSDCGNIPPGGSRDVD